MVNHSSDQSNSNQSHSFPDHQFDHQLDHRPVSQPITNVIARLRAVVWWIGLPIWLFAASDRGLAALFDGYLASDELLQIVMVAALFISWLTLKPELFTELFTHDRDETAAEEAFGTENDQSQLNLEAAHRRMEALSDYHLVSQSYVLPFSYLCQIYHLLNLKHLESIHSFSLNNLRVLNVTHLEKTDGGGLIKFQTILDSPWNILRIWRQPIAEIQLALLTPYTVELSIPVYGDKAITILFNAIPISPAKHQFRVDIYSNLEWYKPVLKALLHFASTLTLIEDLPYLLLLSQKDIRRLVNAERFKNQEMMWLYRRFLSLYGTPALAAELS
jgi:hypothetical protein